MHLTRELMHQTKELLFENKEQANDHQLEQVEELLIKNLYILDNIKSKNKITTSTSLINCLLIAPKK